MWNYNWAYTNDDWTDTMINRTNNPLESFNGKLNDAFPSPRPNMVQFLATIKLISNNYVDTMKHIKRGRAKAPKHTPKPILPPFPQEYIDYCEQSNS